MNKEQVIKELGKENWKAFLKYMEGQTVEITKDGKIDYFELDVIRFKKNMPPFG